MIARTQPVAPRDVGPPAVSFAGREWSADEMATTARAYAAACGDLLDGAATAATVLTNEPAGVALFFGLSTLPTALIVLPPDPVAWRTVPPIPAGTPLVLPPGLAALSNPGTRLGLRVRVVADGSPRSARGDGSARFLGCPGLVLFTSGSTGAPRPVYRRMAAVLADVGQRADLSGLPPGSGVACSLPFERPFGINEGLLLAAMLGGPLGLLERFEHRGLLELFASGRYGYWAGTPYMADVLTRCRPAGPHPAPGVCTVAGRISPGLAEEFLQRFGTPLRGHYGSTETGRVAGDFGSRETVRPDTAGRIVPGVEVRVGADPLHPYPAERTGQLWVRSPWYLDGYGFPPATEPRDEVGGWWPTRDAGRVDAAGWLTIAGRLDDSVKTRAGYLVNLSEVAGVLGAVPDVAEVAVCQLDGPGGLLIAALVEGGMSLTVEGLHEQASSHLPSWSRPQIIKISRQLPRLPDGKVDRRACTETLGRFARLRGDGECGPEGS